MHYKRWTAEEDNKVIEAVKRHPENLQYCFYTLSRKLGRTPESINYRYYSTIKPNLSTNEPIVFVGSPKRIVPNGKIVPRDKKGKKFSILKAKWQQLLAIITDKTV